MTRRFTWEAVMSCLLCRSGHEAEFAAEMVIHFAFSSLKNLDNPGVRVSPKILVCLDCGFLQFILPAAELALIARGPETKGPAR